LPGAAPTASTARRPGIRAAGKRGDLRETEKTPNTRLAETVAPFDGTTVARGDLGET